jgi:hypothetical protein
LKAADGHNVQVTIQEVPVALIIGLLVPTLCQQIHSHFGLARLKIGLHLLVNMTLATTTSHQ